MSTSQLTAAAWETMNYRTRLHTMTSGGWELVSEGASGAQLKKAKVMGTADKWCIGIGIPLIFFFGIGFLLVAIGILDYLFFTKDETYFLPNQD